VREVWVSESATTFSEGETEDIALAVIEGGAKPAGVSEKEWKKLSNLKIALGHVRQMSTTESSLLEATAPILTVDMITTLHGIIGHDIIPTAGSFRETHAGAAGLMVTYSPPAMIRSRLELIVKFVNAEVAAISAATALPTRLQLLLRLSAFFFAEFLKVHPFANGNGRTARLLVSYILCRVCVVPISIFSTIDRKTFLDVIMEAQWSDNPSALTTLVLLSARRTASMAEYLILPSGLGDDDVPAGSGGFCCMF
jgi:Fic family protein